jgi:hypothetical protein
MNSYKLKPTTNASVCVVLCNSKKKKTFSASSEKVETKKMLSLYGKLCFISQSYINFLKAIAVFSGTKKTAAALKKSSKAAAQTNRC